NRERGIGANALFIQLGGDNLLIDSGLHPKMVGRAALPDFGRIRGERVDLILVTHCHLDHIGSLPVAMREFPDAPVVMSSSSRIIIERMLHNSANVMKRQKEEADIPEYPLFTHEEIDRAAKRFVGLDFGVSRKYHVVEPRSALELTLHGAGNVAGAVAVELQHKHRSIFLTGDVLFDDLRTLPGARFPAEHFDAIIT